MRLTTTGHNMHNGANMHNGHKNWNHWNVSLWLFNDEWMYREVKRAVRFQTKDEAARSLLASLPAETPDGAPYTFTSIRAALAGEL